VYKLLTSARGARYTRKTPTSQALAPQRPGKVLEEQIDIQWRPMSRRIGSTESKLTNAAAEKERVERSETHAMVDGDNREQSQDEFLMTSDAPASVARVRDRARDCSLYTVYIIGFWFLVCYAATQLALQLHH